MSLSPIALFAYNRLDHTRRTLDALRANDLAGQSELFVFSDGPKSAAGQGLVDEVRAYVRSVSGFKSVQIIERPRNLGLAESIISGVGEICACFGRVIVLEDDLVTSQWFLTFMNRALELYRDDARVASVHGYCYPAPAGALPETFFLRGADCWGWATWSRAWEKFDPNGAGLLDELQRRRLCREFDLEGAYPFTRMLQNQIAGRNDSWAIRWHAACFLSGHLTLYPGRSLVENIGQDGTGTHCEPSGEFTAAVATRPITVERIALEPSAHARRLQAQFLRGTPHGGWLDSIGMGGLRSTLDRMRTKVRRTQS
jgi:hypothetical protein